ncbi:MAG TPA: hypothetical protein VF939_26025 [Puia sp.]
MTNQGNKHPSSGNDKQHNKNQNQPTKGNQGKKDKGAQKVTDADFDPNSPEKRIQIDDNPEETKRKIPH